MRLAAISDVHGKLMALDLPAIAGNHERQLLSLAIERQAASDRHAVRELSEAERALRP